MDKKVVTRMAPSPTGEFHIGGMRTLLFNWAFARHVGGKFILRIEDTDKKREVEGAKDRIKAVIRDFGLDWDDYFEQSERLALYQEHAKILIDSDNAYYCFCSEDRLNKMRQDQKARGNPVTKYDKKCRSLERDQIIKRLSSKEKHVIRLKVPENETISFTDLFLDEISFNSHDLEDLVLLKSDGYPTYHLAVVVDDHLMEVSHVMRGSEWLPSTPKHTLLYKAFGWNMPEHGHLPNLKEVGSNKKLSKRFGDVHAKAFLDNGYLSEALLNFLMLLGWNPGTEKEFFTIDEFIKEFSLEKVHTTDLIAFDRVKLDWMNQQYIQKTDQKLLVDKIYDYYNGKFAKEMLIKIVPLIQTRITTLKQFEILAGFFFEKKSVDKKLIKEGYKDHIESAVFGLEKVKDWKLDNINSNLMNVIKTQNYKVGDFFMSLRIAVTGSKSTPPINESLEILGKKETLARLKQVLTTV